MLLQADTINGVYRVYDFEDCSILTQDEFYERLPTLKAGEVVAADVDEEAYRIIDEEYGVRL